MLRSPAFMGKMGWMALAGAALGLAACGNSVAAGGSGGGQNAGGQGGSGGAGGGQGGQGGDSTPEKIPLFVAQGHAGRTTVSCDDGKTWVANRSDDDAFTCFVSPETDCDHHTGAGRGITYGNGYFVATFGWGKPGSLRRSKNGAQWENTLEGKTFAGIVFGDGMFLAGERPPQASTDDGLTWTAGGDPMSDEWNVRRTGFAPHDGGRFLLAFGSTGNDLNVSQDKGATWARPSALPAACAGDIQWSGGFAYGNGAIVVLGGTGVACRSLDGGDTWTEANIGGEVDARLVWTGAEFVTWGRANNAVTRFTSSDGAAWTATPTEVRTKNPDGSTQTSPGPSLGAVARSDAGTYVAVNGGWQQWYDKQRFYRSTDGLTWDELETGTFVGSHPIQFIAFGVGERSAVCP
jgi:hypothetical protein